MFSVDIRAYLDEDYLIGRTPSPQKWSTGNALLETAIAVRYMHIINPKDTSFLEGCVKGINSCKAPNGSFNKNPGRDAEITHDDLMGAASTQGIGGSHIAEDLVQLGEATGWNLGNTGAPYFTAYTKPWHVAAYKLMAKKVPTYYEVILLCVTTLFQTVRCLLKKSSPSGDRLRWLQSEAIGEANLFVDLTFLLWAIAARKRYTNVGNLHKEYYGNSSHPFVVYGKLITF